MPALTEDSQTAVDVCEALQHGGIGGVVAGVDKRVVQFGRHAWLDVCGPVWAPGISDDFQQSFPRRPTGTRLRRALDEIAPPANHRRQPRMGLRQPKT